MRLTSSYTRVKSGYMPLEFGSSEPSFIMMMKDLNNTVLNTFHLASTVAGTDDLAKKIETLPPEEQKKYAGYWKRVKRAIDRFVEGGGGDVPPSTDPE